jgi:azurin
MSILVDGKQVGKAKAPSLFNGSLNHGLRTGRDVNNENRISENEGDFSFRGNFQNAVLELNEPASSENEKGTVLKAPDAARKVSESVTINIKVVKDIMQFDKKEITVEAGQKVILVLENPDGMQHNLVIIKPGTLEKVGAAADLMARDPKGAEKHYVPQVPEVLHATTLVGTGESVILEFTAPSAPGEYPYVCTFPGHWRGMNGVMKVVGGVRASQ